MRAKVLAVLEILLTYMVILILGRLLLATGLPKQEAEILGWSYSGSLIFIGVPALVILLTSRRWEAYGVTLANWQHNLELGLSAYLALLIPLMIGFGGLFLMKTSHNSPFGALVMSIAYILAIAVMLRIIRAKENRLKKSSSTRGDLFLLVGLLLLPMIIGIAMRRLNLVIVSTVIWQFLFSGFGEEFVFRGYVQSRLNQAFGRPYCLFGMQFGAGLIFASLLFGLLHAFNTFDPATGKHTLAWGWAAWTTFSGLFLGILREKTGSLLASGIAHGLPDAVGEAAARIFGWMAIISP